MNNQVIGTYLVLFSEKRFGDKHEEVRSCMQLFDGRFYTMHDDGKGTRIKQITPEQFIEFSNAMNKSHE